jgi:hypothetical protein
VTRLDLPFGHVVWLVLKFTIASLIVAGLPYLIVLALISFFVAKAP